MIKNSDTSTQASMQAVAISTKQVESSDDLPMTDKSEQNKATLSADKVAKMQQVDLDSPSFILGYN
ncbi:hypothetical protein CMT41_06310 [Colwellia sp. MT41]|uniref:Uncharacterized protein n=1 Tax=Colwellia marinimaniae TaxID=1513592 RepID=A0ABQ0MYZ9_9GAMM|nr:MULTISPECIES: hypothetical protein [Colwellia]ALO34385.1 hypothetical protein CMT41_06310 [Colwellia sp. MT41]GAW97593.1 hypothetical protein MTCD1_03222 [Colwellia marinimaniae]